MARDINSLYNLYQFIIRKERGVFQTVAQFTANLDAGQLDSVEEWFAPYGETQILHDALRKLRVYQLFNSDSSGFVTFEDDYIHLLGQPFTIYGSTTNRIEFCNEDELPFALTSQLRPVSNSYPLGVDTNVGFSIYPQQSQTGAYWYIKRPATPVLSYTQVNRAITYVPGTSVQLEFSEVYWNNILAKALIYAGVNMDEDGITKYAVAYDAQTKAT